MSHETHQDVILKAALGLPEPFTAADLVVAAWKAAPGRFALDGYAGLYPDANAVLACLMGERGLVRRGLLERVEAKVYRLTPAGRASAKGEPPPRPAQVPRLTSPADERLRGMFASGAWRKWRLPTWDRPPLTWDDALRFWGAVDEPDAAAAAARAAAYLASLDVAAGVALSDGRHVAEKDVTTLGALHAYLLKRYAARLDAGKGVPA